MNELRAILNESDCLMEPGPWTWDLVEGPDGHWTNTFVVNGPEGEHIAECEYRPQAELLVAAHNHLGALLDVAEAAEAVDQFLSAGHACLDCGYGDRHRDDCVFVRFRAALDALTERP